MNRWILGAAAAFLALMQAQPLAAAEPRRPLVIGGGEVSGYYFPVAGAICRVLNKDQPRGMSCSVMPSSGSAANAVSLHDGAIDAALIQSRILHLAFDGDEGFKPGGPMAELRALMSLHGEPVVVLARPGAGISTLADLKGKRVNLGRPGTFQRVMADAVLEAAGVSEGDLAPLVELDMAEQGGELCEGNVDAAFFTGVHPMPEVAEAIEICSATLVPVKGRSVDAYLARHPWLAPAVVRGGAYGGQKSDVESVGPRAVLVAGPSLSAEDGYEIVKAILANFNAFTHLHPALGGVKRAEIGKMGVPIPLHEGASRFLSENGLR